MELTDIENLDPFALDSVPYEDRCLLPSGPGIYFALTMPATVSYIGLSRSIQKRWRHHSKRKNLNLKALRIAWMPVAEPELRRIEEALILRFDPPLNGVRLPTSAGFHDIPVKPKRSVLAPGDPEPWSEWGPSGIRCRHDSRLGWEFDFWPGDYQEHLRFIADLKTRYGSVKAAADHFLSAAQR